MNYICLIYINYMSFISFQKSEKKRKKIAKVNFTINVKYHFIGTLNAYINKYVFSLLRIGSNQTETVAVGCCL